MDTAMAQENLEEVLDQAVREVTERVAGVRLCRNEGALGEDVYTVHISFSKGFRTSLTLCADAALLARMARNVWKEEIHITPDIEDFCMEFFNILCGKIAATLFRLTKISARFSTPEFYRGRYAPADHREQFVLMYTDERRQGVQLTHYVPQTKGSSE